MKTNLKRNVIITALLIGMSSCAFAKDLTMTYQQFISTTQQGETVLQNQLKGYSNLVIAFQKGDQVPVSITGNILATDPNNPPMVTVEKNFWLKLPMGKGDILVSSNNQNYMKLDKAFRGSIIGVYSTGVGAALNLGS